ncbi:putative protein N(5)-glutamine methyltransferase [Nocardioides sp.]|uniref:putative protein N(5)-glutamine methyltransferase n=1 Tax=Nocardioides sp. TaxID=35761 RepID=UPI0039E2A06C
MTDEALVARLRAAGCVFAEEEAALLAGATEEMVARRVAGEPLETVLGWAGFAGIRVACAPGVFVPRVRSELLVRLAVAAAPGRVLDLGCGTGALGAAVASRLPGAEVWAIDVDPAAVACARGNLPAERVLQGDLFEPLPDLVFDVILANAPYVPTEEIALLPAEARDHEHRVALDGGPDGLDVQRRVIAAAPARLAEGGLLLVESSRRQAPLTRALMARAGLAATIETDEEIAGTAVLGRK